MRNAANKITPANAESRLALCRAVYVFSGVAEFRRQAANNFGLQKQAEKNNKKKGKI